jgi:negative regulator of flagellin synthesis FlgM
MIDRIGKLGQGRVGAVRGPVEGSAPMPAANDAAARGRSGAIESSVFELVAEGPPVDSARVAAIRAAIAEGRYPVDPEKIAERMIALDFPPPEA